MGRTAKTATAEKPLPLPLQFLAAWIAMWLGEHQARVIEYQRAGHRAWADWRRPCIDTTAVRFGVSIFAPASPPAAPSGRVSSGRSASAARSTGISTAGAPRSARLASDAAHGAAPSSPAPRVELSSAPCTVHFTLAALSSVVISGRINWVSRGLVARGASPVIDAAFLIRDVSVRDRIFVEFSRLDAVRIADVDLVAVL
jgi:hypothetical protein